MSMLPSNMVDVSKMSMLPSNKPMSARVAPLMSTEDGLLYSPIRRLRLPEVGMPSIAPLEASVSPRMIVAAPRLTRLCEFEAEQLEAKYKRDQERQQLESRMAHIAVVTALLVAVGTVMNVAAGCHHYFVLCSSLVCGCWLTYAGYAHLAASRGVPLARVEHVFVGLCIFHHTTCILLYDGLRMTPILGRSVISEFQIFLVALAAAYAQLDVRHCTVIACAGTLVVALNRVRLPAHCYAQSLPPLTVGWLLFCHLPGPHVHARFPTALSKRDHRASLSCRRSRRTRGGDGLCQRPPQHHNAHRLPLPPRSRGRRHGAQAGHG
mmetsp:Transcript_29185/g.73259  ORF Transcript_29185/g.73259 Transcript_29185/m.73259 type:complete len:322 (-) Transcript_29185:26-991(-)